MVVGCKCGSSSIISKEWDKDYGAYYCVIWCEYCGYYWEGFINGYVEEL